MSNKESKATMSAPARIFVLLAGIIVVAAVVAALISSRKEEAAVPQAPNVMEEQRQASIWLSLPADQASLAVGQEGMAEIRFDTNGQGVSVVQAVVTYDPSAVEVLGTDGAGSALPMEAVPPDALKPGRAEVVRFIVNADQRPDYQGFVGSGLFARLRVKPLKEGTMRLTLSPSETKYAPYATAKEAAFSEIINGEFIVQ